LVSQEILPCPIQKKTSLPIKPHQIGQGEKKGNFIIKGIVHPHSFQDTFLKIN
jgi:hypothetical protein